jgi:hypothetical protein
MAKRQRDWARRKLAMLHDILGNVCAHKHKGKCKGEIQIDCIIPQGDKHHKMDSSARASFYHKQLKQHNLQLLCEYHNAVKDKNENPY